MDASAEGRRRLFPQATVAEWSDWRWHQRHAVRTLKELERYVPLTPDERAGVQETAALFRIGISPYYLSLIDPEHPNVLYVGSETAGTGGAFKSVNGGDSWTAINDGLDDRAVFGMAMDTDRPRLLYIAGPSGIYRTTTGGE